MNNDFPRPPQGFTGGFDPDSEGLEPLKPFDDGTFARDKIELNMALDHKRRLTEHEEKEEEYWANVEVDPLKEPAGFQGSHGIRGKYRRVWVENLPEGFTEADLWTMFGEFGDIKYIKIPFRGGSDHWKPPIACISFTTQESAELALSGKLELAGNPLVMKRDKQAKPFRELMGAELNDYDLAKAVKAEGWGKQWIIDEKGERYELGEQGYVRLPDLEHESFMSASAEEQAEEYSFTFIRLQMHKYNRWLHHLRSHIKTFRRKLKKPRKNYRAQIKMRLKEREKLREIQYYQTRQPGDVAYQR